MYVSKRKTWFTCNFCLFAQDLLVDFLQEAALGIPTGERVDYIDCHYHLSIPVTEKMPEFNLRPRQSIGCGHWRCEECGRKQHEYPHESCLEA